MAIYRYGFLSMTGRVEADFTLCWPSDDIASELAREMLASSGFASLEMHKSTELIYRIGQTDAHRTVERRLRSWCGVSPADPSHAIKSVRTETLRLVPSGSRANKAADGIE